LSEDYTSNHTNLSLLLLTTSTKSYILSMIEVMF